MSSYLTGYLHESEEAETSNKASKPLLAVTSDSGAGTGRRSCTDMTIRALDLHTHTSILLRAHTYKKKPTSTLISNIEQST